MDSIAQERKKMETSRFWLSISLYKYFIWLKFIERPLKERLRKKGKKYFQTKIVLI